MGRPDRRSCDGDRIIVVLAASLVRAILADRVDARLREAAHAWIASRPRPPLALPDVFAAAFTERR